MGAFDQFKDQADESADKRRTPAGNRRNKAAGVDNPGQMERGQRQDGQQRRTGVQDDPRERMGAESDEQGDLV
ncbi:hypothetical protein ACFO3J_19925 [Streptomyces polygonati]|uniref:Uncharacterized protein n=1 Tax=Streptomyces polygonati TaxID=1617087 RepID=A0ABV8HS01_9ACTN